MLGGVASWFDVSVQWLTLGVSGGAARRPLMPLLGRT
jgi:hypothetical protein